ncbi:MAG: CDP-diacylglycerol--serine O-phosphatidyltransferase [candidate division KSB1 bacterium]|nr:CDP-diacylglycerol--serine O-phosphatidyltransferase [candidate division KSB1 bacterium]MDZ7275069.1 CDP-diacylglycerol--serine O-phosphatidyltransferase [candidate division KSB1 bacterium]MDZ7286483.1 CDP-diacylglycerol--serine O-phosphatidyltransferase [candidate division KSB1 bacterium]MDZ7299353.1 CDP-diacylglycerol--serine O-phosphatidyltransferase [candidate division KSB1 bacterium]MDZ7306318.1 CDP-diacylglycerol--serine O-phosphatidyltransferase [candidate division KSB1 bacterium]
MLRKQALAPNLMTLTNLLLGFLAIVFAANGKYVTSGWLTVIAAVCDVLDGKIARALHTSSDFGIEFDSLADVVSFGVAPAFLIYRAQLGELGLPGVMVSFLPLAAGAIRLARFNTTATLLDKHHFVGMPIPVGASLISSYLIFCHQFWGAVQFPGLTITLLLIGSTLMVSTIEFDTLPKFSLRRGRQNTCKLLLLLLAVSAFLFFPAQTLFPLALAYILMQVGRALRNSFRDEEEEALPDVSISKR